MTEPEIQNCIDQAAAIVLVACAPLFADLDQLNEASRKRNEELKQALIENRAALRMLQGLLILLKAQTTDSVSEPTPAERPIQH